MSIYFGTSTPSAIKRGTSDIAAMYYGATQVWPVGGGGVVTDGLQAYYDIGQSYSGTTLYDLSGNGRDSTLVGSSMAYSGSNGGVISKGTASSNYIDVPTSVATALNGGNEATIMQWIKLAQSPPSSDTQVGFMYMTNQTNGIGQGYPYTDNNIYTNVLRNDRPNWGNPVSNLAVWHVMTIRTSTIAGWEMLINTTQQAYDATGVTVNLYNNYIYIGASGGGLEALVGALGPTLIYNKRLSDTEYQQNISYFSSRF
jgi:hypothetical protein